jgi:integrase
VERERGHIVPWIFHRNGKPITSLRKAWDTACTKAGYPSLIPHDMRRSAVRNLERAGVPRATAMKMVGHQTESVYRRYAVVNESDLTSGSEKLAAYHETARAASKVVPMKQSRTKAR